MAYHPDSDSTCEVIMEGRAPDSLEMELTPAGRWTGRLVDSEGVPLAGEKYTASISENSNGENRSLGFLFVDQMVEAGQTKDLGDLKSEHAAHR
jgi:hypothetical protein